MRCDGVAVLEVFGADGDEYFLAHLWVRAELGESVEVVSDLVVAHAVREEVVDAVGLGGGRQGFGLADVAVTAERGGADGVAVHRAKFR